MALESWVAPAKLNLFLHVVGKRDDGYHLLQTLFQLLDYGDELAFDVNDSGKLARAYDYGFDVEQDLCLRAARLLQHASSERVTNGDSAANKGVTIHLNKKLPMGGGLGGGSSNAATTLLALNHLWQIGLSRAELTELALQLGADVPVFVQGLSAWAEGVGEVLTPVELPQSWFLVLIPPLSVSTAQIFAHKHLTPRPEMMKIRAYQEGIGENHLEPIVRAEYPEVDALFGWLSQYGQPRMTGSGGAVFMTVNSHEQGLELLAKKPSDSTGFVAKGLNKHPLYALR